MSDQLVFAKQNGGILKYSIGDIVTYNDINYILKHKAPKIQQMCIAILLVVLYYLIFTRVTNANVSKL